MDPVVGVAQGQVRGAEKNGVLSFKGIPYAAAPFGANRFAAPQPAPSWDGVRDALEYGPTCPAGPYPPALEALLPEPRIPGEECLNLNVWTPALDGELRPVLVWIHGGGFTNGSNAVSGYDGTRFARDGLVCVSINYRLGADGFLFLEDAPANRGSLDQIAALRWVQENITAFGGDPNAVTIAGESAGAMSVTTLLSMPAAEGLFQRLIGQSGAGHHVLTAETAAKVTAALAEQLGVEASVEGFSSVPLDALIQAQGTLSATISAQPDPAKWGELTRNLMLFEPVIDGAILPSRPIDGIAAGAGSGVDVLTGSNAQEHALFLVPMGVAGFIDDTMLAGAVALVNGDPEKVVGTYRAAQPDATPGELMIAAVGDWFFRIPAIRVAEARKANGADTYVYEFLWPSPQFDGKLGACHALEIAFTFDNLDDPLGEPMVGSAPPQALADEMHGAWVSFVKTGSPGWAPYGSARTVRQFDATSATVNDPNAPQRQVWEGVR
ncbi:MAG TPA: carboxylesterase family protein [Frankiaceae bacterium]|jgi:para-nitrobenzyl esterase|nr:carboxylesterase family protein [Frankiaceae bacterium]